jgi:hypothetical protein
MSSFAALVSSIIPFLGAGQTPPEQLEPLHALIRPQGSEYAWYEEIPWLTSIQEALEKAAAEGKPILVWTSADGQPCGAT